MSQYKAIKCEINVKIKNREKKANGVFMYIEGKICEKFVKKANISRSFLKKVSISMDIVERCVELIQRSKNC